MNQRKRILQSAVCQTFTILAWVLVILGSENLFAQNKWVGTWSASQYDGGANNLPPSPGLANNTSRQIVRVSIGGDTIRVKFSNAVGNTALTMNSVTIAASQTGTDAIDLATLKTLKFNGNSNVTINAKATVTSDAIAFKLTPSMRVAISINYGQMPSTHTGHAGARTPTYILTGNKTSAANFSGAVTTEHWYTLNTIDVRAPSTAGAVAILGNSITDGYGLTGGLQNRWTDVFSERLLNNPSTQQVAVLNQGIGGTLVTTSGKSRYANDILGQEGLAWVIIFYAINDINGGQSASAITSTFKQMITDAHNKNSKIKVYGATITPENGNGSYTPSRESVRSQVNQWIRTPGNFDGVIDFDKAIRNPQDTTRMLEAYKNDWLHPNIDGYKLLGESVNLSLFASAIIPPSSSSVAISSSVPISSSLSLPSSSSWQTPLSSAPTRVLDSYHSALQNTPLAYKVYNTQGMFLCRVLLNPSQDLTSLVRNSISKKGIYIARPEQGNGVSYQLQIH